MARFAPAEKKFLARINDTRLVTSISIIRQAMEDVWAADAPRIIQDFTDHGEQHCVRLSQFAQKLLAANDGRPLSEKETYVLLASIYLHDVGMQCDVRKFPAIKTRAEALGAQFEVRFAAESSNRYSPAEQKALRKSHHLVTAAWLEHALESGETVLAPASVSIPRDLFDDVLDVCKHHSTLPITDCPVTFTLDSAERKQLVAALLRLSDELDIDSKRVNLEVVKTFAINPANTVFWWLHHQTKITFTTRNVIRISIWLGATDYRDFADLIQRSFIDEFQSKNRSVLEILRQNGIPMAIDAESGVEMYKRAQTLPADIISALEALQKPHDPEVELAQEVRTWLRAVRYELSEPDHSNDSNAVDMIATLDLGAVKQRVLVRCLDREIGVDDVAALDALVDRKTPQGWLITDMRVAEVARQRAAEASFVRVFTLAEFLTQMVWGPYFDFLKALVEKDRIPKLYVDLGCYKQRHDRNGAIIGKDSYPSLTGYLSNWLGERGKAHISILAQFGAGKTWFCRYYAYMQLQRYLADPVKERMPLLITLRAFSKAMTAQQLINDALLEQYKLPFVGGAYGVFREMNRRGKLLLILDGFDEMARQVDYQTVVDNFWELAKLVDPGSKVILTSRTEYFRWAKESEKILAGEEFGRRTIVLEPPKFEVLHVEGLSEAQIREMVVKRVGGSSGELLARRLLRKPHLVDMARKPVLVELLLAALDEVSPEVLENPARVYLYATNKLLLRNIDTKRTFTTTADKLYFLCELAWEMLKSGELRVHYTAIPDRIKQYFGDRIKDQHELDTWDFDLRSQTLLHRDAAGYYEFAHKSLAEFFVAIKFAAEIDCLDDKFASAYSEADGRLCVMPIAAKQVTELAHTFGAMMLREPRMNTLLELLPTMLAANAAKKLWRIIADTRNKDIAAVQYVGGNVATLLRALGKRFTPNAAVQANLSGADLRKMDLSKVRFTGAELRNVDLRGSSVREEVFDEATVVDAKFELIFRGRAAEGEEDSAYALFERLNLNSAFGNEKSGHGRTVGDEFIMVMSVSLASPFDWKFLKKELSTDVGVLQVAIFARERAALFAAVHRDLTHTITRHEWREEIKGTDLVPLAERRRAAATAPPSRSDIRTAQVRRSAVTAKAKAHPTTRRRRMPARRSPPA
jgi:hypothetical protein